MPGGRSSTSRPNGARRRDRGDRRRDARRCRRHRPGRARHDAAVVRTPDILREGRGAERARPWSYEIVDTKLAARPAPARSSSSASTAACSRSRRAGGPSTSTSSRRRPVRHAYRIDDYAAYFRLDPRADAARCVARGHEDSRRQRTIRSRSSTATSAPGTSRCDSSGATTTTCRSWRASRASSATSSTNGASATVAALAVAPVPLPSSRSAGPKTRTSACASRRACSSSRARDRGRSTSCGQFEEGNGLAVFRSRRRATSSSTSKATPFAREGGREYLFGLGVARRRRRAVVYRAFWALTDDTESARPSTGHGPDRGRVGRRIRGCTSTTTRPYEPSALQAADGPLRDARRSDSMCCCARGASSTSTASSGRVCARASSATRSRTSSRSTGSTREVPLLERQPQPAASWSRRWSSTVPGCRSPPEVRRPSRATTGRLRLDAAAARLARVAARRSSRLGHARPAAREPSRARRRRK